MNTILCSEDEKLIAHWKESINEECGVCKTLEGLSDIESSILIVDFESLKSSSSEIIKEYVKKKNRVIVFHISPELSIAKNLLSLGVMGYGDALMKGCFILSSVQTVEENLVWICPKITQELLTSSVNEEAVKNENKLHLLTTRETEVSKLLVQGFVYKLIAQKLEITPRTVKAHAQNIYKKLEVKDRLALILLLK